MTSPDLQSLLERVKASEGPDREIDAEIEWVLLGNDWTSGFERAIQEPYPHIEILTPYTASLDAALALVERKLPGIDAAQMLHEALEDMANGGWRDDQPIVPQICRYLILRLLTALNQQAEHAD